ncbi:MAG: hypothetical protein AAF702_05040 [Chloroflexota bacterium]
MDYLKVSIRAMWILFGIGILLILLACTPAMAQAASPPDCRMLADGMEYRLVESLKLNDRIPEASSRYVNGQMDDAPFMRAYGEFVVEQGTKVLLSGSREGSGFVADDLIKLSAQPSGKTLAFDFRSQDFTRIDPVSSAHEISSILAPGPNRLEVDAYDLLGPVHSASELWLLILEPCHAVAASASVPTTLTVADIVTETRALQPNPQTAVDAQPAQADGSMIDASPESIEHTDVPESVNVTETTELAQTDERIEPQQQVTELAPAPAPEPQRVTQVQQRSPFRRGFFIGLFLALTLISVSTWRGRESLIGFYMEAAPHLARLQQQAKARLNQLRDWLESLQD